MNAARHEFPEHLDLQELISCPEALACLSEDIARRLGMLPIAISESAGCKVLIIACNDVMAVDQHERVAMHIDPKYCLQFVGSPQSQLSPAIESCYREGASLDTLLALADRQLSVGSEKPLSEQFPILLVNALIRQAARMRASDIHLSPEFDSVQIRFRVDGVLLHYAAVHKSLLNSLLVRLKIMALLDIAETRYPQDGQFRRLIDAHPIDFRLSTFPTVAGENTVLRLIDASMRLDSLKALNLPTSLTERLSTLMHSPDGLIVVCGPTGAGKSTTLFALLDQINKGALNIMTLEDPVEHRVSGIRQTTIDASRQWGYAQGLRALLRQDPDVVLVGEIRDPESCEMALRAVSTGHQILTTVHASCAHSALHRLRELNADGEALGLGLVAVLAQRLIRKICTSCHAVDATCGACHGTGFSGRQVIVELLEITADIKALLVAAANIDEIRETSMNSGFVDMRTQAMTMVAAGETSTEELYRVFGS